MPAPVLSSRPGYRRRALRPLGLFALLTLVTLRCGPADTAAQISDASEQIAAAALAAPDAMLEGAAVFGFAPDGTVVSLRDGSSAMVCLADNPTQDGWSVAWYHQSLEPFMAMGRELRA